MTRNTVKANSDTRSVRLIVMIGKERGKMTHTAVFLAIERWSLGKGRVILFNIKRMRFN